MDVRIWKIHAEKISFSKHREANHLPASGVRFDCGVSLYLKPTLGPIQPFTQEFNQRLHRSRALTMLRIDRR